MSYYYDFDERDYSDDGDPSMANVCPACNTEYDDIDYEYQICHLCKFDNSKK